MIKNQSFSIVFVGHFRRKFHGRRRGVSTAPFPLTLPLALVAFPLRIVAEVEFRQPVVSLQRGRVLCPQHRGPDPIGLLEVAQGLADSGDVLRGEDGSRGGRAEKRGEGKDDVKAPRIAILPYYNKTNEEEGG